MRSRLAPLARWLAVAGLAAAALVPLLSEQLPRSADGRAHLFRVLALETALRQGEPWPRFSPDLAYGYGYPLFHFYAPLTYYLGAALRGLGLALIPTLNLLMALALVLGAWGAFTLAEAWYGPAAGLAAAAVYTFAPYPLFNLFTRGAVPEALALALLPWLWWSLDRAVSRPTAGALLRLALLVAVLFLLHNLSTLVFLALLLAWLVITSGLTIAPGPGLPQRAAALGLALLALPAGAGLAAFYWLPAVLETGAVQVAQLTAPATLDFRNYFVTPAQLFWPAFTFDPRLEPPNIPVALGLPQALLSIGAVLLWLRASDRVARGRALTLAALLAGLLFLTTALSRPVWELLPFMRLAQFPWRFLGPATLLAALLAGALVGALDAPGHDAASAGNWPWGLALVIALATALTALPWTFVRYYPPAQLSPAPTLEDLYRYEVEWGGLGLTSTGEFLPRAVQTLPPVAGVQPQLAATGEVDRLDAANLPAGVSVLRSESRWLSAEAAFRSERPFTANFLWFYFPGWQAELDGRDAGAFAAGPHGFLAMAVPAGEHTVRVFFDGATPLRQAAAALSMLALAGLACLVWWSRRFRPQPSAIRPRPAAISLPPSSFALRPVPLVPWLLLGLLLALTRLWAESCHNPFCRSRFDGQTVRGAAQTLDLNFGDRLNLIGFDPPRPAAADQPLTFTLYWRLYTPVSADYSIAAQLWDAEGHLVGQQDSQHPGGQPTRRWLEGGYAADEHALTPYPGTPPGDYRLMIGVYPAGDMNAEVRTADGLSLGRFYEAGHMRVLAPARLPSDAELRPAQAVPADLGPVRLIGVDGLGGAANAGDALPLVLYWRLSGPVPSGARLVLELADTAGSSLILDSFDLDPSLAVRLPRTVLIPPGAADGPAEVRLSLDDAAGMRLAEPVTLGSIMIHTPARSSDVPDMLTPLGLRLGEGIEILGFDLGPDPVRAGAALDLILYWRSLAPVRTRYTVFVHVLDAQGRIVAQVDAPPAQGARPTTGWLPPEVITDRHVLQLPEALPAGSYVLTAGLYDPRTGARLAASGGDAPSTDSVRLRTIDLAAP